MKQFFQAAASLLLVLGISLVTLSPLAAKERPGNSPALKPTPYVPGVVYVKMRSGSTALERYNHGGMVAQSVASEFSRVMSLLHATATVPFDADAPKDKITRDLGIDRMYVIYYSDHSIDAQQALAMLMGTGEVECGSVRYVFPKLYTPNDARVSQQYAITNMHLKAAWDVTTGDSNILIADVDDAMNVDHEDLKNAIKVGYDVVGNVYVYQGQQFQPDNDPRPDFAGNTHGSHTAGCIAASGNNGVGIAGSGFGCRMIGIKATGKDASDGQGNAPGISGGYEGIHFAATHGARVINCSWGGPASGDQSFANTLLLEAQARNALVVAASGNNTTNIDNTVFYPACGPGVLAVGATGPYGNSASDQPADYSNYGAKVGIWAPGTAILSCSYPGKTSYDAEDGTSFASPLVAGVAGLLTSLHPDWAPHFIARQIHVTADNTVVPEIQKQYWGRINAGNALSATPQPGLIVVDYAVDGVANDSLRIGAVHTLNLTFKNVTAAGSNIKARLVRATGYSVDTNWVTLGSVALAATAHGDFSITRSGVYSEGLMPVLCELSNGADYDDIVTVYVPLTRENGFVIVKPLGSGSSIKRTSQTAAWASYGVEDQTSGAVGIASYARQVGGLWSDTAKLSDGSQAPYCVEASDSLHAWFGTGPKAGSAKVVMTTNGGQSFTAVNVSGFTPFVNSVHFFDDPAGGVPKEGIIIGDPASTTAISSYGIGRTTDGGKTWIHVSTVPNSTQTSTGFEASWNNSQAWVGDKGWFGTNNSKIWRTTNRGTSWLSASTSSTLKNSFSIAFDDDGLHGFACFRSASTTSGGSSTGGAGMSRSSDGGASWKKITMPAPGMIPGVVTYIKGTDIAIVTGDSGIFKTTDFGTTWSPIGVPLSFDAGNAAHISAYRDQDSYTVSVITSQSGVASYSEAITSAPTAGSILFDATQLRFGQVTVGTSKAMSVKVTNAEKNSVTINKITLASASGAFQSIRGAEQSPIVLAPGAVLLDTFGYAPMLASDDTARVTYNVTGTEGTHDTVVTLIGQGLPNMGVADGATQASLSLTVSPNPTHGELQIALSVPSREHLHVAMFDAIGREVALLLDGEAEPGTKLLTFSGHSLVAGTYYVVLTPEQGQPITRAISIEK